MAISLQTCIKYGKGEFTISGPQIDSAAPVVMRCHYRGDGAPACFVFRGQHIAATIHNVLSHDERGLTTIGKDGLVVRQVEHVLSALLGMGFLSTDIELSFLNSKQSSTTIAPPICHLNATDYVLAISRSFHTKSIESPVELGRAVLIEDSSADRDKDPSLAIFAPLNVLNVTVHINFPHFWGKQSVSAVITRETYGREIAWARSFFSTPFPHRQEWSTLKKRFPALLKERMDHSSSIMIDYTPQKWITPLLREDEPTRHKLLDLIGDLALLGKPINAGIFVYKPSHRFNRECVRRIYEEITEEKVNLVP